MAISFTCACGKKLKVSDTLVGKKVKCPDCQKISLVSADGTAAPAAPARTVKPGVPAARPGVPGKPAAKPAPPPVKSKPTPPPPEDEPEGDFPDDDDAPCRSRKSPNPRPATNPICPTCSATTMTLRRRPKRKASPLPKTNPICPISSATTTKKMRQTGQEETQAGRGRRTGHVVADG